jgi:phosphoglycerate dehydrogenase-like enzyme
VAAFGGRFIPAPQTREERIAQVDARIGEADILLGGRLSQEQWRAARKLRWIHVPWAGVNSLLDTPGIGQSDVIITNASGVMSDAVADQIMAYILMLSRDLLSQVQARERREWLDYPTESPRRQTLRGRTLGLLGYGAIGSGVAARARGFGMRIAVMRRSPGNSAPDIDLLVGPDGLPELLEQSDYLVVTLPLSEKTRGLLGREEFRRMKRSAYLINIARGSVVRQEELIEALRTGEIAGAALDVFEQEPLPQDSPLWEMENVIVTPHSSGGFQGFWSATVDLFLDNLRRFLAGEPLHNRVEPGRGY